MPSRTIRDLLLARLGVPTTPQTNRSTASVGTTAGQILRNDTGRVAFLIVNLGAFSIFVVPQVAGQPSPTLGVLIQANGGALSAKWDDDGEVVAWEWLAIAVGGASAVYVQEAVIDHVEAAPSPGGP